MVDGWRLREKPSEMKTRSLVAQVCTILFLANAYSVGIASQASANDWNDLDDDSDTTGYGWDHLVETQGPSGIKVTDQEKWGVSSPASSPAPQTTSSDDLAHYSNDAAPSTDARAAGVGQACDGVMRMYEKPDGTTDEVACLYFSAAHPAGSRPTLPTTREILYYAATTIHADGAGLRKRPDGVSYTNRFVPTIVSVTNPTQTHVINLLGRDITITLTATNYEYSWGDGTPNTVTTSTGLAWRKGIDPNNDPRLIRHYYTPPQGWRSGFDGPYPHENREITLRTTWSGTATNPFTGETQTINGLVTTTETTGPFPLSHLVINNTDTWEEKQGHEPTRERPKYHHRNVQRRLIPQPHRRQPTDRTGSYPRATSAHQGTEGEPSWRE